MRKISQSMREGGLNTHPSKVLYPQVNHGYRDNPEWHKDVGCLDPITVLPDSPPEPVNCQRESDDQKEYPN